MTDWLGAYALDSVYFADVRIIAKHLPPNSVDLIFTDPPYDKASAVLYGYLAECANYLLKPGGFVLAMAGGLHTNIHHQLMSEHLTYFWTFQVALRGQFTGKAHPLGTPSPIITRNKPVYAYVKGRGGPRTVVYGTITGGGDDKLFHHWGQEMRSARYLIDCFSHEGDVIIDPFCGGGTTLVVSQALNRRFIGFDIDLNAVEVCRARVRNPYYTPEQNGQQRLAFAM